MHRAKVLLGAMITLVVCLLVPAMAVAQDIDKPYSIAVLDFAGGDSGGHASDATSAIPTILTTELAKSNRYTVVERDQLDLVRNEQALGQGGELNPETTARLGKVLGVEYLLIGKITELSIEKGKKSSGKFMGFGTSSKKSDIARVSVAVKVVDTESARVVAVVDCRKSIDMKNSSNSTSIMGFSNSSDRGESKEASLADVYYEVARDLADQLETVHFKSLPPRVKYTGFIGHIENNKVYINLGSDKGIEEKMVFDVRREVKKGSINMKKTLGQIRVIQADDSASECEILKQETPFKVGDLVETKF